MRSPKYLAAPLVLVSALVVGCTGSSHAGPAARTATVSEVASGPASAQGRAARAFAQLERRFHARLGLYLLDTGRGRTVTYRAGERFAFCSTSKALAAGVLLKRDTDHQLDQVITYKASDLVEYSPITSRHVGTGMRLRDLIAAAVRYSDNTAENLLLSRLGGPAGLQAVLRGLGDKTTNVDHDEPAVNDAPPGDVQDTSTPTALGADLRRFVLGDVLTADHRNLLTNLIVGNTTGGPYIRAGLPAGWKVGDKTGNGEYGRRNDIAITWPPGGSPIVIAVLSDRGSVNASSDDALIADATKAALAALR